MKTNSKKWNKFCREFKRDWQLLVMVLIPVIYVLIFSYGSMYGVQVAFRDYRPRAGITGSEWVGLQWFEKFLTSPKFFTVLKNTVVLSVYSLVVNFPLPIIFALMLHALRSEKYKRTVQVISYIPHFISTAVIVALIQMLLSPVSGIYGMLYQAFNGGGYPMDFRGSAETFRHIYVWSSVWQGLGWETIIYTSALAGVSQELHEAAQIDGASRVKRIFHIDIPSIMPMICMRLILTFAHVIGVGFDKAYMLQTDLNISVSEVIATYVYKNGLNSFKNFSYGTAVGLFNTAINLTLMVIVNSITKRMSKDEVSLF